jgi:hypothetical protein
MQIPWKEDWGTIDENSLDAKWAFDTFLGRSLSDAEAMFQSNALDCGENLQSMPSVPYNFYASALVSYTASERARGHSDGASSFLHTACWLLKTNRAIISPHTERILVSAANQVAQRQEFYEANVAIYGCFADLNAEIQRLSERGT